MSVRGHISTIDIWLLTPRGGPALLVRMARALRIERPGGRYHVTARGNERKAIFRDEGDRFQFLELLSELEERFGARIHAYVLMDNHYHLLVETPEANLSRAMHWLGVSYSVGFNRREQAALKRLDRPLGWPAIISGLEAAKGERWAVFRDRYGDWGRDAVLWLGRRRGRLSLAQLGVLAGGLDYAAVGQAVSRFGRRLKNEPKLKIEVSRIESNVSNVEI